MIVNPSVIAPQVSEVEVEGTAVRTVVIKVVLKAKDIEELALEVSILMGEMVLDRDPVEEVSAEVLLVAKETDIEVKVTDIMLGMIVVEVKGIQIESSELINELKSGIEYGKLVVDGTELVLRLIDVKSELILELGRFETEAMLVGRVLSEDTDAGGSVVIIVVGKIDVPLLELGSKTVTVFGPVLSELD